jgi:hypothetical protein
MLALRIARTALIFSLPVWAIVMILAFLGWGNPVAELAIAGWDTIALGISALACLFLQALSYKLKPRKSSN